MSLEVRKINMVELQNKKGEPRESLFQILAPSSSASFNECVFT